ncbi:hypothetical protein IL54_4116 [Sphingobium sp. ba1]|nr:hypothetical protein IL54_4116 [Sphingobium sp. ba1]
MPLIKNVFISFAERRLYFTSKCINFFWCCGSV